jgi:hypothetical protein
MLSEHQARFLANRRVGHLATADARATPHLVPVCFAVSDGALHRSTKAEGRRQGIEAPQNIVENPLAAFVAKTMGRGLDPARLGHATPGQISPMVPNRLGVSSPRTLPAIPRWLGVSRS